MFDRLEIRKVANGFVVTLETEDGDQEYVFDSVRKAIKFVRDNVEGKASDK